MPRDCAAHHRIDMAQSHPGGQGLLVAIWIQYDSAGERVSFRGIANHKAVTCKRKDWCRKFNPGKRLFARLKPACFESGNSGCDARRSVVKIYRRAVLQETRSAVFAMKSRGFFQNNNQRRTWPAEVANGNDIAALDLIHRDVREIDGGTHSRLHNLQLLAVALNGTNTRFQVGRVNNDLLSAVKRSTG